MKMLNHQQREILQVPAHGSIIDDEAGSLQREMFDLKSCQRLEVRDTGLFLVFRNTDWGDKALRVDAIIRGFAR